MRVDQQIPIKFLARKPEDSRIDWPLESDWHWISDIDSVIEGIVIILGTLFVGWLALPRKKSDWEDAAVKMDLGGKDRWT